MAIMGRIRSLVLSKGWSQKQNSDIFNKLVNSHMLDAIRKNDIQGLRNILKSVLPAEILEDVQLDELLKS